MTTLNDIRVALESHLASTSASPAPALPAIAWPNVPFVPVTGNPYLRVEFIPVTRRPVVAGPNPEQRFSGLFYLTVYTPEEQGAAAGIALADKLMARFNGSDAVVTTNAIVRLEYSEAKMALHTPPFYAIPIEIGWYAYSS
jgi:hypothetical protein